MFAKILKSLREKQGLNQKELAEKIGLSYQRYNHYERGKREPDIQMLKILSQYFNVSVDYLLGLDENTKKELPPDTEVTQKIINMFSESGIIEKNRPLGLDEEEVLLSCIKTSLEVYKNLRKK